MKVLIFLFVGVFTITEIFGTHHDVTGTTQFTGDVYKQLTKTNSGSFMASPLSVDVLLALLHGGAKGKTAQEISTVLHLPESEEEIAKIFADVSSKLKNTHDYDLNSANTIFLKKDFGINEHFKTRAVEVFDAEIENVDFGEAAKAEFDINNWVQQKTNGKIKELVTQDDFQDEVSAILINAMYFNGKWVKQFSPYGIRSRPFYRNNQNSVDVTMMEMADEFNRFEDAELNAKFLEMPYEGNDVTMTFVLPNEREGLAALEEKIHQVLVKPNYEFGRVHVVIPIFEAETSIQFKPILLAMGMIESFYDVADFTNFGANQEPLTISKIIQKTFISVNEKGTEAAAGTAGLLIPLSAGYVPPPQMEFIADHPFLYFIKIKDTVLFIGRYNGP